MSKETNILVLCTGNSLRSQLAEGFIRHYMQEHNLKGSVQSAGIKAHGLNPLGVAVMKEIGIDISQHTSKNVSTLEGRSFDFIITVCDHANEHCPYFPGGAIRLHENFPDPSQQTYTSEKDELANYRKVRDLLSEFCKQFVQNNC